MKGKCRDFPWPGRGVTLTIKEMYQTEMMTWYELREMIEGGRIRSGVESVLGYAKASVRKAVEKLNAKDTQKKEKAR